MCAVGQVPMGKKVSESLYNKVNSWNPNKFLNIL